MAITQCSVVVSWDNNKYFYQEPKAMSITIGSNYISGSGNIDCRRSGNQTVVYTTYGKTGDYPSFTAACTDSNWRYGGQLGGSGGWRQTSTWPYATWAVNQRGAGSYGFNTSNGRYYAPVTGYYMFGMNMYMGNTTNNSQGYTHVNFLKNGGTGFNSSRHGHSIFGYKTQNFYMNGITMENVISLTEGQYVSPGPYWGGGNNRLYCGHFQFFGHLIN